ncbi:glycosyltransferase [Nocardioides sp. zg-1230]|uniref:glycosyltransferase n=1 Tax=Nocardioides sp. zg-1230 TaxID=2736601 RepID=UPI001C131E89
MKLDAVAVVVPARDEEALLPACLDSVATAVTAVHAAHPLVRTRVVVVLDACRDGSAEVVAARDDVEALSTDAGCVGVARSRGVHAAAAWSRAIGSGSLWVASTDADSVVPPHWLTAQLARAADGLALVVGTVVPRPGDLSPAALSAWHQRHTSTEGHDHVHGANLGFTLEAYRSVGGFLPLHTHEDVRLVAAMRRAGVPTVATGDVPVVTSGRRAGRAPGGFAHYLDELAELDGLGA